MFSSKQFDCPARTPGDDTFGEKGLAHLLPCFPKVTK
jgi:hypothetical protein